MSEILAIVTTIWGVVMALAPILQLRVIIKQRDSSGISLIWVCVLLVGFLLWFSYGLVNGTVPLIITNAVSALIGSTLLVTILVFRRPRRVES